MYSKELTIEEVYAVHGNVEHKYISKLKFNSKQFTKVGSTGWDGLEPVTADFSINYLNLGTILCNIITYCSFYISIYFILTLLDLAYFELTKFDLI